MYTSYYHVRRQLVILCRVTLHTLYYDDQVKPGEQITNATQNGQTRFIHVTMLPM